MSFEFLNKLNEARVERTIDAKLWASVNSGCSRTYKQDLGKTAKPIGTREQLLQRFVAGLIILKQQCPITENDMRKCPAFTLWANKLLDMGVTMDEVHKLWNENCGKLPKVDTTMYNADAADDETDDLMGVDFDNDEENAPVTDFNANVPNNTVISDDYEEPVVKKSTNITSNNKSQKTARYYNDPEKLAESVHQLTIGKGSQFTELYGGNDADEFIKYIPNIRQENINVSPMLNKLDNADFIFALRVFRGGNPNDVTGDVVWNNARTKTSYYVAVDPQNVSIFFKDENGDLTMPYTGTLEDFGLVDY